MSKRFEFNGDCLIDNDKRARGEEDITVCDYDDYESFVILFNQQDQQISDLEAKLAKNKKWLASNEGFLENQKLKQQLAEKEDFIKDLMTGRLKPVIPRIKEIEKQYQDKISFAVEQLEKVKDHYRKFENTNMGIIKRADIVLFIDNQIEELKKEMK